MKKSKSSIAKTFFEILHSIKLYHLKIAQKKVANELHEKLSGETDRFIELLMGKKPDRIQIVEDMMQTYEFDNIKDKIFEFRQFLIDLNRILHTKKDGDLLSVRNEMLESVNRILALFTLYG